MFKSESLTQEQIDEVDKRGNTPLLLATKLSFLDEDYLKCVNFLFK